MRSEEKEVTSAAVCQGPAPRASMDKKTPKKNRHPESGGGGHNLLMRFFTLGSSKIEVLDADFSDTVIT